MLIVRKKPQVPSLVRGLPTAGKCMVLTCGVGVAQRQKQAWWNSQDWLHRMPVNRALSDRQGLSANVKAARSALERKVKSPRNLANGQSLIVTCPGILSHAGKVGMTLILWNHPNTSRTSIPSHHTILSLTVHLSSSSKLSHCLIPRIPIRRK